MTDQEKEVKPDAEVESEDSKEPEDKTPEEGENKTQSESSSDENEKESDDSSGDSETDSTEEGAEEPTEPEGENERLLGRSPEKGSPKRVKGESVREFALRCEVHKLKSQRRSNKSKELFTTDAKVKINTDDLSPDDKTLLASYNKEELASFEKMLGVIAKKNGWVNKGDLQKTTYKTQGQDILDDFLDSHPEYSSENDPDNVLWDKFTEDFSLYKQPSNPKLLKRIFNKIHRDIFDVLPESDLTKIQAQKQKIKSASHSGATGNKKVSSPQQSSLDPSLKKHMKGFDDKELDEIFS